MKYYNNEFYSEQINGSRESAKVYFEILSQYLKVDSIIDIGCGRGPWLSAAKEFVLNQNGKLIGIDGPWNSQYDMIDNSISYIGSDLNKPLNTQGLGRFDLCMSIEVAEHLHPNRSSELVNELCTLSDVVMFSAAYLSQGGTHHINERKHSYWAERFLENNYVVYDIFRHEVWGNSDVELWHQQNIFLYVKKYTEFERKMQDIGVKKISNLEWLNAVHPELYAKRIGIQGNVKYHLMKLLPQKLVVWLSNKF